MSAFEKVRAEARKPSMVLVVPPSVFADVWDAKPTEDVALGLRLLSESDLQAARRVSTDNAVRDFWHAGEIADVLAYTDACNDGIVCGAIARALCDPNDASKPHPMFPFAEDLVEMVFTTEGARFVWDELHRLTIERSPLVRPIEDTDVDVLALLLQRGALAKLPPSKVLAARKLLGEVLEDCAAVAHLLGDEEVPVGDDESVYVVTP